MTSDPKVTFGQKVRAMFQNFLGAVGLWVFPYPVLIFKRALAGRLKSDGELEFYCHPRFAIASHVIFIGWLTSLGFLLNASVLENHPISPLILSWPWLMAIGFTLVAMGRDWEIISSIMVAGGILLTGAVMVIMELTAEWELFKPLVRVVKQVPVDMDWGGPFVLSLFLGFLYVLMASYQRVDDVWRLPAHGNLLDHYRFERSDTSISKGGKTFRADWPCMLKKWFFFGYGNILILDAHSKRTLHCVRGVFFAHHHAEVLKTRFATTDATLVDEEVVANESAIEDADLVEEESSEDDRF